MKKGWVILHQRYGGDAAWRGRGGGAKKRPKRWGIGGKGRKLGAKGRSKCCVDADMTLVDDGGGPEVVDGLTIWEGRASMAFELPMMMMT